MEIEYILFIVVIISCQTQANRTEQVMSNTTYEGETYHPCTFTLPFSCGCKSIWDSDCYCSESTNPSNRLSDHFCNNCDTLYKECWNFNRTLSEYNLNNSCPVPLIEMIRVNIFTTSLNPEGIRVVNAWKEILEVMGDAVNFNLYFVLWKDENKNFASPLGPREVLLDTWMLCAIHHYPRYHDYYPYIYCLNNNNDNVSMATSLENCAKGHNLNFSILQECVNSEGKKKTTLLEDSMREASSHKVPSVVVRSNTLQSLQRMDFINALCNAFSNPISDSHVFPWWIFTFMACIAIALLLVIWVAKSDASWGLSSLFCGVFYEIDDRSDHDNAAEEVLRLWQAGTLPDEDDDEDERVSIQNDGQHQIIEDSDESSDISGN